MQRPARQGDLILDLEPVFFQNTESSVITFEKQHEQSACSLDDHDGNNAPLLNTEATSKVTIGSPNESEKASSTQQNILKMRYLLQGYNLSGQSATNLTAQSKTFELEKGNNISAEHSDTTSDDCAELTKSFNRANSTTILHKNRKDFCSSFWAAYQPDAKDNSLFMSQSQAKNTKKKSPSLGKFDQVVRIQRSTSAVGYRQKLNTEPSVSPERGLDEEEDDSVGKPMVTAPDEEYTSVNSHKVLEERKELRRHFKKQGVQKYENKVLRQELERQMKILENRVKRLTCEEENIKKNIKKTENVTKKAIDTKQRYFQDLARLDSYKMRKLFEEQQARQKIKEEKMKRTTNIKNKKENVYKEKAIAVQHVKTSLQQDFEKTNQELKKETEKKQRIYQSISEFERGLKVKKNSKQQENFEQMTESHVKFLQEEHLKTLEIENKIRELAKKEEHLINKIKETHQIQIKAESIMKKVLTTKVERTKQPEFRCIFHLILVCFLAANLPVRYV